MISTTSPAPVAHVRRAAVPTLLPALFGLLLVLLAPAGSRARGGMDLHQLDLENGFRVMVANPARLALETEALLVVAAGTDLEPAGAPGLARTTAEALLAGPIPGGEETVRHYLARSGITAELAVGREVTIFRFTIPTFQTVPFVHFLAGLLAREAPGDAVWKDALERHRAAIANERADLWRHSTQLLDSLAWKGVDRPEVTDAARLAVPELEVVRASDFRQRTYRPERMVFSIWGEFPTEMVSSSILKTLSRLPAGDPEAGDPEAGGEATASSGDALSADESPVPALGARRECLRSDAAATPALLVGTSLVAEDDFAFYGWQVLAQILGASDVSRLYQRLRVEESLTYTVEASCSIIGTSGLTLRVVSQTHEIERAHEIILEELARLREEPVSEDELVAARAILRSRLLLDHETLRDHFYRDSLRYLTTGPVRDPTAAEAILDQLTPERLQTLVRTTLDMDRLATLLVSSRPETFCARPEKAARRGPTRALPANIAGNRERRH